MRRATIGVLTVLACVALAAAYNDPSGDTDLWWHLAYGEQVVEGRTWDQDHGQWSWIGVDTDWRYVSWIADALFFLAYRGAGLAGLSAIMLVLYLGVVAAYLVMVRRFRGRIGAVDLFAVVATFLAIKTTAVHVKPEMFTVLFFGLTTAVYVHARLGDRDRFWLLPVVYWLWINAHGGVLVGYVLLVGLMSGEALARRSGAGLDRRAFHRLVGFGSLALLVTAVNPAGPMLVVEWIRATIGMAGTRETELVVAYGNRWGFLWPDSIDGAQRALSSWLVVALFAVAVVGMVRAWRRDRQWDPVLWGGSLFFFLFSMQVARAVLYFPLFFLFTSILLFRARREGGDPERSWIEWTSGVALVVLTVMSIGVHTTTYHPLQWAGSSKDERFPVAASRFVREAELPGPIFNDYLSGGYLVWDLVPTYRVFVDPRSRPYPPEFLDEYFDLCSGPTVSSVEAYANRHGFRTALVDHRVTLPLARAFLSSSRWTLVYLGPVAAVFVRNDVVSPEVASEIERNTDPVRLAAAGNPFVIGAAANLLMQRDPGVLVDLLGAALDTVPVWNPRRAMLLDGLRQNLVRVGWTLSSGRRLSVDEMQGRFAGLYLRGDLESARVVAAAYLIEHPADTRMRFNLACVESRAGNLDAAATALDRALSDGLADPEMIWTDTDLDALRATPRFRSVVERHGLTEPMSAR